MVFFVQGEKIVLKADSTWIADGIEITHELTRDLFFRSIHFDAHNNCYYLAVGYERINIEVEGPAYFVTQVTLGPDQAWVASLADHRQIEISADNLLYSNPNLYLILPDHQRALFLSAAFYECMRSLQEDQTGYFLTVAGKRVDLLRH